MLYYVCSTNLQVMGKLKLPIKSEDDCSSRDKYITWTDEATRFMLDWYIELCADALNGKFSLGSTQNQVDRHYRLCKEKWSWV